MVSRQMLVKDLEKVLSLFKPWGRQNNSMDRETRFIYDCNTYSDLEARITAEGFITIFLSFYKSLQTLHSSKTRCAVL